jgi:hypothetical protein
MGRADGCRMQAAESAGVAQAQMREGGGGSDGGRCGGREADLPSTML